MARNLFTYALLGGISSGADALAKGMAEERRMQQEMAMRKALQDDQQAFRESLGYGSRAPGAPGATGARITAQPMTAEQAVADANTISQMPTRDEIAKLYPGAPTQADPASASEAAAARDAELPGQAGPTKPMLDEQGKPLPVRRVLDEAFYQKKARELVERRERFYAGPNADKFASAQQTQTESNLLEKAGAGDRQAGEGLLYNNGKDPQETVARAEAQIAKAEKDDRTDPNARRGGSGGGAPKAAIVRSTEVDEQGDVIAVMSDGTTKPLGIKSDAFNARVAKVIGDMEKNDNKFAKLPADEKRRQAVQRLGAGGDAPAQSGNPRLVWDPVTKTFKPKA